MGRQTEMRVRLRQNSAWAAVAAAGLGVFSLLTLVHTFGLWGDYSAEGRPAFDNLVSGRLSDFLHSAPGYGGSLLMRAPFVLAAHALGAGDAWIFRASLIPVLAACGALAWWLAASMGRAKASWLARLLVVGLCVLNPIAMQAVKGGHPEELLGAVLCVAAVLCAIHDRPIWAGVLLGLAIANKEWALLGVGPVLVALRGGRVRSLAAAAAVASLLTAPFLIAGTVSLDHGFGGLPGATTDWVFTRWQWWWFFGTPAPGLTVSGRLPPSWIHQLAHPLIIGVSIPLTLMYVQRARRRPSAPGDTLLLLALLLLLRCVLDPWDYSYYSLPFLFAVLAWDALRPRRLPVLALTASFVTWFVYTRVPAPSLQLSPNRQALIFIFVSVLAAAALACGLYAPGFGERLRQRAPRRARVGAPLEPGQHHRLARSSPPGQPGV